MNKPFVSIIVRAFNRLEYTSLCLREIDRLAGYDDYEIIVINQNSTDGTRQWLNSLVAEGYYKLKVKHNQENSGDAGGMKDGFDMISPETKYVMQFDNDCYPITENFLSRAVAVMEAKPEIGTLMMKREGVDMLILPLSSVLQYCGSEIIGEVEKATCCAMIRRELLDKLNVWFTGEKIGWGFSISKEIKNLGLKIFKAWSLQVYHTDSSKQSVKYPSYFGKKTAKGSNFSEVYYQ